MSHNEKTVFIFLFFLGIQSSNLHDIEGGSYMDIGLVRSPAFFTRVLHSRSLSYISMGMRIGIGFGLGF